MAIRACLIGEAHTRERERWSIPINDSREWMRVLDNGDVLNYQLTIANPGRLRKYDVAIIELTPPTHHLPRLIKRACPDLLCVGLVEGRVEYVVRSNKEMEGLFSLYRAVSAVDVLGILVERTLPYYRLYRLDAQCIQWLGVPYPKDYTDRVSEIRQPKTTDLVIQLGAGLESRNGIANILVLKELQRRYPSVRGRICCWSERERRLLSQMGVVAEACPPMSWQEYYRQQRDVFAVLCMDDRRTWGRYALDAASARIPFVGSRLSHCGEHVGILTCDPFDTGAAVSHLSSLIEERLNGAATLYDRVVHQQYTRLGDYDNSASRRRFRDALANAGFPDAVRALDVGAVAALA